MENFEIEKKYLIEIDKIPFDYRRYPFHMIEQAYLCTEPVVRVRRQDEEYYMTYKSKGLMVREEYNMPLTKESYEHLVKKADGVLLTKRRYLIPYETYTIELDVFEGEYTGLLLAEVEFENEKEAEQFKAPEWFGEDVTYSIQYQNSVMSIR